MKTRTETLTGLSKLAKAMSKTPEGVGSSDWLAELDEQYKHWKQVEHVAVWGGSFEREHGARMELKALANKMFDTLLKLLAERSSANAVLSDRRLNKIRKEKIE